MNNKNRQILLDGVRAGLPICLGYIPIGLAFGVIAQKAGLGPLEIALMSILVFAGSSQFIAVSMIFSNAGILSIIMTTFMVNLRHFLMSSSLSRFSGGKKAGFLSLEIFQPKMVVAIPTFLFALKTRSLAGTVVVGMGLFWLAEQIIQ